MELRFETAQVLTAAAALAFSLNVTYEHGIRRGQPGTLQITNAGVSYLAKSEKNPRPAFSWSWDDIQRLELSEDRIRVLSYQDRAWLLGSDRPFDFKLPDDVTWREMYGPLRDRLDSRFVARVAVEPSEAVWEIPAKLLSSSEGRLYIGRDSLVYKTRAPGNSRTWRLSDVRNVSSTDQFQLSVTTLEKTFDFQLKKTLPEAVYQSLWMRLNAPARAHLGTPN